MNLVIQGSENRKYVSFRQSYWDPARKMYSSRTVKNFGRLDVLLKKDPNIIEKLRAEVDAFNESVEKDKQRQIGERVDSVLNARVQGREPLRKNDNCTIYLGACIYRQIWNKLGLQRKLRDLLKDRKVEFNFPDASFFMVAGRSLMPDSKFAQWQARCHYLYGADKLKLIHLYRALEILCENKESIVRYLNRTILKEYRRAVAVALYDVTTYYFESQNQDELRNFGFSKDNKVNQVQVVMGMLIDEKGIPIDYELYPGNQSEFKTMVPILKRLKEHHGIERVVVTADRGLNSGANLHAIKEMGLEYVMAYRLKGSGSFGKNLIASKDGWIQLRSCGSVVSGRCKIASETRTVRLDDDRKVNVTSNLLVVYSATRALKDAKDRERLLEKAKRYEEQPALLKSDMHRGGRSFLDIKGTEEVQVKVDYDRARRDELFDGYYGIVYSDKAMTPREVLSCYHSLWQIEESFRISKSILDARPCFHWKSSRIRGHFLVCYLALVMHRILEFELEAKKVFLTAEQIVGALRGASIREINLRNGKVAYNKDGTTGNFEKITEALGLGDLPDIASATEVKQAFHIRNLEPRFI